MRVLLRASELDDPRVVRRIDAERAALCNDTKDFEPSNNFKTGWQCAVRGAVNQTRAFFTAPVA